MIIIYIYINTSCEEIVFATFGKIKEPIRFMKEQKNLRNQKICLKIDKIHEMLLLMLTKNLIKTNSYNHLYDL